VAAGVLAAVGLAACGGTGIGVEMVDLPFVDGRDAAGLDLSDSTDPALAVDPETGDLLLAWVAGDGERWDLFLARSADAGRSWSPPVRVNHMDGDIRPHGEGGPRLVAAPGVLALFWSNRIAVEGRRFDASDMRFARSTDGGATWTTAISLQDDTVGVEPRGHTFHGAGWGGDSDLVVAWIDGRERDGRRAARAEAGVDGDHAEHGPHDGDGTIYFARSTDLGATWEAENHRLAPGTCPCCRIGMARGPDGELRAAWRKHFPDGSRDIATLPVTTGPGEPVRVAHDRWGYPGCPHTGPGIAIDEAGRTHVAWFTGREGGAGIYYARSDENGAFGEPLALLARETYPVSHADIALFPDGRAVVAHNAGEDGAPVLVVETIGADGRAAARTVVPGSEGADRPQLLALDDRTLAVIWTDETEGLSRVRMARLEMRS
jgi:hypothetical protein